MSVRTRRIWALGNKGAFGVLFRRLKPAHLPAAGSFSGGVLRGSGERDNPGHAPAFANRQDGWQRDRRGRSPESWLEEWRFGATEDRGQRSTEERVLPMPLSGRFLFVPSHRIDFIGIGGMGMSGIAEILLTVGHVAPGQDLRWAALVD